MIKPGFFTNETIADLSPHARLCFIGLWTLADREGRLEDRPKRIKLGTFPFEEVDIQSLLTVLENAGLIRRYRIDGEAFIVIPKFSKHQHPHQNEPPSVLPLPPKVEVLRPLSDALGRSLDPESCIRSLDPEHKNLELASTTVVAPIEAALARYKEQNPRKLRVPRGHRIR